MHMLSRTEITTETAALLRGSTPDTRALMVLEMHHAEGVGCGHTYARLLHTSAVRATGRLLVVEARRVEEPAGPRS